MGRNHVDDEQSDEDFIHYLNETLIPDLTHSGFVETAKDFNRLLDICLTEERWLELKEAGLVRL